MPEVSVTMEVPYGHRLMSHLGKCATLHGHNGLVEVIVRGPLNAHGMVIDFHDLRTVLHECLDKLDHAMLLQDSDAYVNILRTAGSVLPLKLVTLPVPPTAENIAQMIRDFLHAKGLYSRVRFYETRDCYAEANGTTEPALFLTEVI